MCSKLYRNDSKTFPLLFYAALAVLGMGIDGGEIARAGELKVSSHLGLSEIYSSNIYLSSSNPDQALVTKISPGLTMIGKGRRLKYNLEYEPELIVYSNSNSQDKLYHVLNAGADAELIPETLIVTGNASVSQSSIDLGGPVLWDRVNSGNRANVIMLSIEPKLHHEFGGYVLVNTNYRAGKIYYENVGGISNSETNQFGLSLSSGRHFDRFIWSGQYSKSDVSRISAMDSTRENSVVNMRYRVIPGLSVLAKAGYENNDYETTRAIVNGTYSSAGFSWTPSENISLDATYGNRNKDANFIWSPIIRTTLSVGYQDRAVGANTGSVWSGKLQHRTRHTAWQASYVEDVTNLQRIDFIGQTTTTSQSNPVVNVFSLTDEEFLRIHRDFSCTINSSKSTLGITAYTESRDYQLSRASEDLLGAGTDLEWRFAARTRLNFEVGWQNRVFNINEREDDWWHATVGVTNDLSTDVKISAEYGYTERLSSLREFAYRENRLLFNIIMNFQGD